MRLSAFFTSLAALGLLFAASSASAGCSAATTSTATVSYSPYASAPTLPGSPGGFGCTAGSPVLSVLGANYLKVSVTSTNSFKLTQSGATDLYYTLSGNAAGTMPLSGTPTALINGTTDVLGLLGSVPASVPLYIKPTLVGPLKSGVYTGSFRAIWDWSFCTIVLGNVCIGATDSGVAKPTDITVSLTIVGGMPATITMTTTTTADDVNGTSNPKAIPGGRQRVTMTVTNPDNTPLASNTMELKFPTPTNATVALDGDGTSGVFAAFTEGTPASGLAFSYVSATSTADDVEFSTNGGVSWTAAPTAATESQVTHVRLKPRGAMAAGSNFKITLSYKVK
jgi:hypothetical protein